MRVWSTDILLDVECGALEESPQQLVGVPRHRVCPGEGWFAVMTLQFSVYTFYHILNKVYNCQFVLQIIHTLYFVLNAIRTF